MNAENRPAVMPSLCYRDPIAAMAWLEKAFGCETVVLVTDTEGKVAYAELSFDGAPLGVMNEWESPQLIAEARVRSPLSAEGMNTQFLRVTVRDLRAHCEQARAAGARIVQEPGEQHYGDRTYRALDVEGHVWNFREHLRDVSAEELGRTMGLKVHDQAAKP
jgi:uncharacterized glyoxalase superfamily protein PhnB